MATDSMEEKHAWLTRLAQAHSAGEGDAPDPQVRTAFDLVTRAGADFYEWITDDDLLRALRAAAARLGHSPAQREVFWVYRTYLRQRFGKWPDALRRAGLSRAAGTGGATLAEMNTDYQHRQTLLAQVREAASTLGRLPHPTDLPQVRAGLQREYATWNEVLSAAGVRRDLTVSLVPDLDGDTQSLLAALRVQAVALNRAPLRCEVAPQVRAHLTKCCGSWRNSLYQVGLEPVTHISSFSAARLDRYSDAPARKHSSALQDCYYRVLQLGEEGETALAKVAALAVSLGRPPQRGEVNAATRRLLQDVCGSWSNALFQLGLHTQKNTE